MFDNLKNMASMMSHAKEFQEKLQNLQGQLGRKTVEGDAGAGAVRVTANGKLEIMAIRLDKAMLASLAGDGAHADQQMIEDLITAATNAALNKARDLIQQEMVQITGGLNIPGLTGIPGMINSGS